MRASVLFAIMVGCADKNRPAAAVQPPCPVGPTPTLTVGHGAMEFMEFNGSDTPVELVHGPQGGVHSNIALHARHVDQDSSYRLEIDGTVGDVEVAYTVPWVEFNCLEESDTLESTGALLIWDANPEALHGQPVSFTATLVDPHRLGTDGSVDGLRLASDSVKYIIWDPTLE
jgi:hypothetical protein